MVSHFSLGNDTMIGRIEKPQYFRRTNEFRERNDKISWLLIRFESTCLGSSGILD